jgi:curved DNA-binding protein CbpA
MNVKDYYSILELQPSATQPEIKKAYRRLAQQFHPDKTNNNPYAAVQFAEIKEAYEVLTNSAKKEYYLQQRWYSQGISKKFAGKPVTPPAILKQCLELDRYVASLDAHRMDKKGLAEYICNILSDSNIEQLKNFNEPDVNKTIIIYLIKTTERLRFQQVKEVTIQLYKLADENAESKKLITDALIRHQKKENKEKYQPLIIILITIIICLLIYLVGR